MWFMYIRKTHTGSAKNGADYFSYRLVQSRRLDGKVKQTTLLNLGRYFEINQKHWPSLCSRVEGIMSGQGSLFEHELLDIVEKEAQRIAAQLLTRNSSATSKSVNDGATDLQTVDVNSLELVRPRTVGVEHVALWSMEQVGFSQILTDSGLNGPQRAAVIGLIIGRMAKPSSELATYGWLQDRSALGELLDVDFEKMNLMQLYRASDLLIKRCSTLEEQLFNKVQNIFGLSCTVTLYDLTNSYFEGDLASNPKAKRGHSKEKRTDCPLLTLGLVLDSSGFVRCSQVFPGNVGEAGTLEQMLDTLKAPAGALVVMDRGIATKENITWLRNAGYRYLVVSRERRRQFNSDEAVSITTANSDTVMAQKVVCEDGQEVRLFCYSEQRAKKEDGITLRFAKGFEDGLQKMADGLSRPRTTKQIDKIWERIGRLREKSRGVSQQYHIEVDSDDTGKKAVAIRWKRKTIEGSRATHPGVYCLRSNELDWDEEQMWRTYIMLTDLEAVFRSLKSELGLRPVYHRKEERCEGHLFITVLAYQFVQIIRRTLSGQGIKDSWLTLRTILEGQSRITASFKCADGRMLHVRKATQPELKQKTIYRALRLDMTPGGIKKVAV